MAAGGALDLTEQIISLVSDRLQVVSYKWLSRNFSVASDDAKRILQNFVDMHGSKLEAVYAVSGWLKDDPCTYHVKLIPANKVSEAKTKFKDNCSVQVYSVQSCIPKDPSVLWNSEFLQSEELFGQPTSVDNCLRDNRFCAILNNSVKRNINTVHDVDSTAPKSILGASTTLKPDGSIRTSSAQPCQEEKPHQTMLNSIVQSSNDIHADSKNCSAPKRNIDKKTSMAIPSTKLKAQSDRPQDNGGSIATLWACANTKQQQPNSATETTTDISAPAEEIKPPAHESSMKCVEKKMEENCGSGKKRKVVFDFSDEEAENENIVGLASPEHPTRHYITDDKGDDDGAFSKNENSVPNSQNFIKREAAQENEEDITMHLPDALKSGDATEARSSMIMDKRQVNAFESVADEDKVVGKVKPASPKKKKVLKTRIDDRGREVTEVVWEEAATNDHSADQTVHNTVRVPDSRQSANNKPGASAMSASNPTGKLGNKKTAKGGKDAKQGNILSFFKKI